MQSRNYSFVVILALLVLLLPLSEKTQAGDSFAHIIHLTGVPAPYSFSHLCRLSAPEMWTVGGQGDVLYQSASGSRHLKVGDEGLYGVYFIDSNLGWVVGAKGTIFHTRDIGEHWEK